MKNKRILSATIIAVLAFIAVSCSKGTPETTTTASETSVETTVGSTTAGELKDTEEVQYSFVYNNVTLTPNAKSEELIEKIGEEYQYFETNSCAYLGKDKVYTFANFVITTYPSDDGDFISCIEITSDAVSTSEGIYIGDKMEKVISVYGNDYKDSGSSITYTSGKTSISFIPDGDNVDTILYTYPDLAQ